MSEDAEEYLLPQLYSRRQRELLGKTEDVFVYDEVPWKLTKQVPQIIGEALGPYFNNYGNYAPGRPAYEYIVKIMRRELAVDRLTRSGSNERDELINWLNGDCEFEDWLDAVELSLRVIDKFARENTDLDNYSSISPDQAIGEFNSRSREQGFGYRYHQAKLIRVDSEFLHKEAVVPVLQLLTSERFKAANAEFHEAHSAFRAGNFKECIVGCGRAFESVLKVIGGSRGWDFSSTDPASKLIAAASAAGFLPAHSQASLNHLRGLLESSVPTIRNKMGGHGAGQEPLVISEELATFQLHQTAAVILFLVEHDLTIG